MNKGKKSINPNGWEKGKCQWCVGIWETCCDIIYGYVYIANVPYEGLGLAEIMQSEVKSKYEKTMQITSTSKHGGKIIDDFSWSIAIKEKFSMNHKTNQVRMFQFWPHI